VEGGAEDQGEGLEEQDWLTEVLTMMQTLKPKLCARSARECNERRKGREAKEEKWGRERTNFQRLETSCSEGSDRGTQLSLRGKESRRSWGAKREGQFGVFLDILRF
jgi:hypothetical protein